MLPIEDRLQILEVIARYSYTYDSLDPDGFANLFSEDAVWEYYVIGKEDPEIRLISREEIREWAKPRLIQRAGIFISRHHQTSTVFDSHDIENPQSRTMVLVTHHNIGELYPISTLSGVYHDSWIKTDAGWKFAHRILYTDRSVDC